MAALDWAKCSVDALAKRREMQARVSEPPRTVGAEPRGSIVPTSRLSKKIIAEYSDGSCLDRDKFKRALCAGVLHAVEYRDVGRLQHLVRQNAYNLYPICREQLLTWLERNGPVTFDRRQVESHDDPIWLAESERFKLRLWKCKASVMHQTLITQGRASFFGQLMRSPF